MSTAHDRRPVSDEEIEAFRAQCQPLVIVRPASSDESDEFVEEADAYFEYDEYGRLRPVWPTPRWHNSDNYSEESFP